jgi:hypothetical protein
MLFHKNDGTTASEKAAIFEYPGAELFRTFVRRFYRNVAFKSFQNLGLATAFGL